MAYSELIKGFSRIRDYMREFYVYGFKSRSEFDAKSSRSYDNERRRIESWLGEYMRFQQTANGKCVFISVDSRLIDHNPLYKAFKAKSFTDNDIVFHFGVLDLLCNKKKLTLSEIIQGLEELFFPIAPNLPTLDESTIRKKLKEYVEIGLIRSEKQGSRTYYSRTAEPIDLSSWGDCLSFFSEAAPLGVIGSYMIPQDNLTPFKFKHHYILNALDSEIMYTMAAAIRQKRCVHIIVQKNSQQKPQHYNICPARLYISVQNGRQYILAVQTRTKSPHFYRLDTIKSVSIGNIEPEYDHLRSVCDEYGRHVWGVSGSSTGGLDHLEMTLRISTDESFMIRRLEREKRGGCVVQLDDTRWQFSIDVYDARELLPWIRTFISRIDAIQCTNKAVLRIFNDDLRLMNEMYGE